MTGYEASLHGSGLFNFVGALDQKTQQVSTSSNAHALTTLWLRAKCATDEAMRNKGREAYALKSVHDYLQQLMLSDINDATKQQALDTVLAQLLCIRDWNQPQWFKKEPLSWKDKDGNAISERTFIANRNHLTEELMERWETWAQSSNRSFDQSTESISDRIAALDECITKRVAVDSLKNWLRRRPDEPFVNELFTAMATNKLYIKSTSVKIRAAKDAEGQIRNVEMRNGVWMFEGSDERVALAEDDKGFYLELPDDADMIVFERRSIGGHQIVVPLAQPNARDPNIQWFSGSAVKKGWRKEQRFAAGPEAFSMQELYNFFPDHFPMRITNSTECGRQTQKVGAAIYGYARDHKGRQSRVLIAEYAEVMVDLKRNNSQLINDTRKIFCQSKADAKTAI